MVTALPDFFVYIHESEAQAYTRVDDTLLTEAELDESAIVGGTSLHTDEGSLEIEDDVILRM